MTKLCRRESKDTLRQKHALALCSRENNPSLIMTITKSRDDSCSSFLRAKLIRKEKRSAIPSQFMNPSRIYQQTVFFSNLMNPFRTSLLLLSYKNPIQQRCCHFLQRKTKTNHQPISQRFHQNTGPSLLIISRE
jgi:hypothetical protein